MAFKWVKVKCAELDITYKALADKMQLSYDVLIKTLHGYRRPVPDFAERVREALREMEGVEV